MVLCWLLGNGCLFAWNGMLTSQDYYVTLFPEHMVVTFGAHNSFRWGERMSSTIILT
ncbi:hypothetical protein Syun_017462 [Stephania yunnanensis]|uniref:Uncharacterized protein n=1 Tax=Stephania yunnanensis TaxID=152371 RepID=A0AAP0P543_9MAGN